MPVKSAPAIAAAMALAACCLSVPAPGVAPSAEAAPGCVEWGFPIDNTLLASGGDDWKMTWSNPELGQTFYDAPASLSGFRDNPPLPGDARGSIIKNPDGDDILNLHFKAADASVDMDLRGDINPNGNAVNTSNIGSEQVNWRMAAPLVCKDLGTLGGTVGSAGPAAGPKPAPTITSDQVFGGIVIHVKNNTPDTTACHYDSEVVDRDFTLKPDATTDLRLVPAVALFRTWHVTVTCDNGAKGEADIDF
jgi:hypothetical protein